MKGMYDDMLYLPHHEPVKHQRMGMRERAAQFSPFAALTGYDDAITETARETDERPEVSDDTAERISEVLGLLSENASLMPPAVVSYFVPDERKEGGRILRHEGKVRRVDPVLGKVIFSDGTVIGFGDIMDAAIKEDG